MKKNKKLDNIKSVIGKAYDIHPLYISKFKLIFSKFTTTDNHFLLKTRKETFFVKRYDISNEAKIKQEMRNISKVKDIVNVPRIIKTKNGGSYLITRENIFVVQEYIDGKNFKEIKASLPFFFSTICDIEEKFVKSKITKHKFYSFNSRIKKFKIKSRKLLKILTKDSSLSAIENKKYLQFVIKEVDDMVPKILSLKIRQRFIHGDLLMQNIIIEPGSNLWIVDWEKSREYITSIDILKSVMFTLFNPTKKNFNLNVEKMATWSSYCLRHISIEKE